ncbi:RsmB/NOP family class I SAM-dependent RNA methyltransferase [Nocardioides montaniterrae]
MTPGQRPQRRPGARPQGVRRPVDRPRAAALAVLQAVRVDDAYTNLVLPGVLAAFDLNGRDAGFTTELAAGTIRRQATYDAILADCIDRPLRKVETTVLDLLRLGVHQIVAMRVPTHAAINTTVDLVRAKKGQGAGGFANAVLRKVAQRDLDEWLDRVAPLPEGLAVRHSHPQWVVDELTTAVGAGEIEALLAADNVPPRVTLVARPGLATRDELVGEPTPFSPYGVILDGGDPGAVRAVAQGRAGVQDEGSQLVAYAAATAPLEGRDERWLDLCAGPGGKAALLAAMAHEQGAGLTAVEPHLHRAKLVERNLAPVSAAGGRVEVVNADGTRAPFEAASFDRVLVDAPCSGLGALRRRPEARWRRTPEDLVGLTELQRALLGSALDLVRPGGVVLYATCSPVIAETADVVTAVLDARSDVSIEDVRPLLPGVTDADGPLPGTGQLWPHRHGTDAMFLALLRRS